MLPLGKSYFCTWEIHSHKHKANLSFPYSERVHLVVCSSRSLTHGMDPSAQGPGDVKYMGPGEVPNQHSAKANNQHLRDFCHLSPSCGCIMGSWDTQETFVSLLHTRKETAVTCQYSSPSGIQLQGLFLFCSFWRKFTHQDSSENLTRESEIKNPMWNSSS